jgi:Spy/CpxP family protein refolding chaperone
MQRSKQQALMFLLGAVLVGGVLGFSTERMLHKGGGRTAMYDDLDLSGAQRTAMDSLLDAANCERKATLKSVQPQLDSIRQRAKTKMDALLTPEQREILDARRREQERQHEQQPKRNQPRCTP